MEYRLLGRTGLRVSPLCLGTMNFGMRAETGVQTEEAEGHRIMDRALDLGINFFDTANVYGDGRGLTESIIGRWFAQGDRRRERIVLATKVYNSRDGWPNAGRLSALAHPPGVRRQPAPAADRPHRPLPDAPRRPRHAVGRDLAGDGRARRSRARCSTSGAATSPGGTSSRRTKLPRGATRSASCPSRASTTSPRARSSSRCCPRAATTASASSRGARSVAGCSAACSPTAWPVGGGAAERSRLGSRHSARSSRSARSCAPSSATRRPTSRSRGCSTTPS